MPVEDTYSKRRQREEQAGKPIIYQYDEIPRAFRNQLIHVWITTIGVSWARDYSGGIEHNPKWRPIHDLVARELGHLHLDPGGTPTVDLFDQDSADLYKRFRDYFLQANTSDALDIIELVFRFLETRDMRHGNQYDRVFFQATQSPKSAVDELNVRFREHDLGYQYVGGQLIRIDSQYIHAEAVEPAVILMRENGFEGPEEEFLSAHRHYRRGEHKESIVEALKAFESTLKTICTQRGWQYDANRHTAAPLVRIVIDHGLVPDWMESTLVGLATLRNRRGGHGQGPAQVDAPSHVAAYALHLAASNIVLLVQAHKAMQ